MRLPILVFLAALLACCQFAPAQAANSLTFTSMRISTKVDLAEVTITFHVIPSRSADVGAQIYLHRVGQSAWDFVNASTLPNGGSAKVFSLYHKLDSTIEFVTNLPLGKYDDYRLLLFEAPDGQHIDYGQLAYDTAKDTTHKDAKLSFQISSTEARVRSPQLVYAPLPDAEPDSDGTYTLTIPAKVRLPKNYQGEGDGLWAMAKGPAGFSQVWVPFSAAQPSYETVDHYLEAPVHFVLKGVKPGIWSMQFGVFKANWGDPLQWIYPGLDFEVGGNAWETMATRKPPRVRYIAGRFVQIESSEPKPVSLYSDEPQALKTAKFIRGGNFGNAVGWTIQPALNTPGYFVLLGDIGCRFVRVLFNPDRYHDEPLYQHAVDQIVQNIWEADEYPLIGPQDLPAGNTMSERIDRGQAVCRMMAENYKGKPVWIEVLNEPHEFSSWAQWKPIAERYVKTIRGVDPDAFVVVPFESWSKDGRGAAVSPLTDTRVDLYDGHAYVSATEVQARFGSATKAGLPVLIGEYGSNDAAYMKQMDLAFQAMTPPPAAIAPWAFTIKGQDSLPLVESAQGATIHYTPTGQVVAHAFNAWLAGKKIE